MDLEVKTRLRIKTVTVKVKVVESVVVRRIFFQLESELDADMARALGSDAVTARDGILEGGMSKVVLPIDAVQTEAFFEGDVRSCRIPAVHGLQAVMTRGQDGPGEAADRAAEKKADEEEPADDLGDETPTRTAQLKLEFECPFAGNEDAWLFLGKSSGSTVEVSFKPVQQELPLGKKENGKKEPNAGLAF